MSFLWTSLIRILSECLDKKDINKAVIVMGTTVATGTFFVYGLSSIFNYINNFKLIFYVASILLIIVALIWICRFDYLVNDLKEVINSDDASFIVYETEPGNSTAPIIDLTPIEIKERFMNAIE